MKKRQRLLAALTAAGMTAAAVPAVAVFADDSVAVTPSKYLQDQKGTLTMTVSGDRDVRVKIEKDTLDGVITYYDTTLENDGTYDFTLDSCEYNVNTETYDSSFTVSVWDKADSSCSYTEEHLVVMDPGFTQNVERSQFDWNLTLQEGGQAGRFRSGDRCFCAGRHLGRRHRSDHAVCAVYAGRCGQRRFYRFH